MIYPFILAGGTGSRLWPLSRAQHPKQFHALASAEPLLVDTARRVAGNIAFEPPLVIANEQHRFAVAAAFRAAKLAHQGILLEPEGRSTAPAAAVAAHIAKQRGGDDALVLLMPADHYMASPEAFVAAVKTGATAARAGSLVTFGVRPSRPETGYGYLRSGGIPTTTGVFPVERFIEKPPKDAAVELIADPYTYWNSGIFLFGAKAFLAQLEAFEPEMALHALHAVEAATHDLDFIRLGDAFSSCPSGSIDYAVMERTSKAAVVPLDAGWSDVGTWDSLFELADKDEQGNAVRGDVVLKDTARCYVRADSGMVALTGVEDLIVVSTKDATLIAKRDASGAVRDIVQHLAAGGRNEAEHHLTMHRPWGNYETLHLSDRYQVKQIVVDPGASLSLQRHHHRAEHWIVVKGTARVTIDTEVKLLTENQSIYVPLGAVHRLENPGLIPLTLIEVQSGSYLGEDDIVRLEDKYARA